MCIRDRPESVGTLNNGHSVVSVMAANNETGVIQPTAELSQQIKQHHPETLFHVDAVQAFCWLDIAEICKVADLVSISAHKFGGPKGVGALVCKKGVKLNAQQTGGSQERGRRAGTHNVPGIMAMAVAAKVTLENRSKVGDISALRDQLVEQVKAGVPDAIESGNRKDKIANIAHLCFDGVSSESLLFRLGRSEVMASAASSCSSGAMDPSHVLAAMGYDRSLAGGSLRLSLGFDTTEEDVAMAGQAVVEAVNGIREANG